MSYSLRTALLSLSLVATTALFFGCGHETDHEHGPDTHTHGPNGEEIPHTHGPDDRGDGHSHYTTTADKPAFTYLAMNGEFHLNPGDSLTLNDPRNPSRLQLTTDDEAGSLTTMVFYAHDDMDQKLAECGYQFVGSRPDPHYYPNQSKTSIWDVFEKVEDYSGDCLPYAYVISRSPHGDPIHMHLRYGKDVEALLTMSNDEVDENFNPWWATYCDIERTTACD